MSPDYTSSAYARTDRDQAAMKLYSENPQLLEELEQNLNRKCPYCSQNIPGRLSEYYNPLANHLRSGQCKAHSEMTKTSEATVDAARRIDTDFQEVNNLAARKLDLERDIEGKILSMLRTNAKLGQAFPCASADEYNEKYDFGRKDTREVATESPTGHGGGRHTQRIVKAYSVNDAGQIYYSPANITRIIDDRLMELRSNKLTADIMRDVDQKLQATKKGR